MHAGWKSCGSGVGVCLAVGIWGIVRSVGVGSDGPGLDRGGDDGLGDAEGDGRWPIGPFLDEG